ncbi:small ribosomal subunit biogenesis GTPase RsgA [Prochlorothrix hollandica]|uniref:small ribosomal subunit biogenesis GTPase RsgA n=1 Tax=Prochlorothrix hollandica TaxID=1223 RepID=UPI00334030B6
MRGGDGPAPESSPLLGTVVAVQANYYRVALDPEVNPGVNPGTGLAADPGLKPGIDLDSPDRPLSPIGGCCLLCTRRSRLKKLGQRVMVGDRVQVEEPDWQGLRGAIAAILPRSTVLDRPPMANANQILLVFALAEPTLDPHQLSRFLVKAESTGLPVALALSKRDLVSLQEQEAWYQRLQGWGYHPLFFSLYDSSSLKPLLAQLAQRITIVAGPSGVGKSSLINALVPRLDLRVGAVSGKLGRGRHTTRHVELFALAQGGLLADSPGFNQPELDCSALELGHYFPEIRQRLAQQSCQFNDCLHGDEPHCGVGREWDRYDDYQTLLHEVQIQDQAKDRHREPDAMLKPKDQGEGQVDYEPRLAQKKYRRESRRSRRQSLHTFKGSPTDWTELDHGDS